MVYLLCEDEAISIYLVMKSIWREFGVNSTIVQRSHFPAPIVWINEHLCARLPTRQHTFILFIAYISLSV